MSFADYFTDASVAALRDSVQADDSFDYTNYLQKSDLTGLSLKFAETFFEVLDRCKKGSLSKQEMGNLTVTEFLTDQSIAARRESVIADNSFDYTSYILKSGAGAVSQTAVRTMFLTFDINKDGIIDEKEMVHADISAENVGPHGIF